MLVKGRVLERCVNYFNLLLVVEVKVLNYFKGHTDQHFSSPFKKSLILSLNSIKNLRTSLRRDPNTHVNAKRLEGKYCTELQIKRPVHRFYQLL